MEQNIFPISDPAARDVDRVGPKAGNLAALGQAGLPIPDSICVDAGAYRRQLASFGFDLTPPGGDTDEQIMASRRQAIAVRLALLSKPIIPELLAPLLAARSALLERSGGAPLAVRSSSLVEDRFGSSFAGQFESYLGLETEEDFLTAVRACWAALWAPRVLRHMLNQKASPADTAMGVLIQPLVPARVSGGGLSQSGEGEMVINATWGLGSAIAQGEVVPDRYVLTRDGRVAANEPGRKNHSVGCRHSLFRGQAPESRQLRGEMVWAKCLADDQIRELGDYLKRAEDLMGVPVEIEWAMDDAGIKLLQSRPLHVGPAQVPDEIWLRHPKLKGHPAGVGWGSGRACVVSCECELSRVGPGDILVTRVAGPALARILPRVSGVVAELGGSTSHLASLARERGIPMVLGVHNATHYIPDGKHTAVDGVAGIVRWMA
jgi:pyruvate, water dikinase